MQPKVKPICSEWNKLFPFKMNNVFWVNLKKIFYLIFFHIFVCWSTWSYLTHFHEFQLLIPMFLKKKLFSLPLWFSNRIESWLFLIVMQHLWTVQKQSAKGVCGCHRNTIFLNREKYSVLRKTCSSSQYLHNYLILNLTFKRLPNIFHRLHVGGLFIHHCKVVALGLIWADSL